MASCGGPEPRDRRRWTGSGRAEERQRSARNPGRGINVVLETRQTWVEDEKNVDRSFFSVAVNPEDLENRKEAGRETQGAQGVSK